MRIQTQRTRTPQNEETTTAQDQIVILRLVRRRVVTFRAGTVNNENLKRKKSKVCCILHEKLDKVNVNKYDRG